MSKRKRGEQLEPAVPPISITRLHCANVSQSLLHHAQSFFPFIPDNYYHPPFATEFLESLNDICRCESSLNSSSTATEIRDVLADCQLVYANLYNDLNPTLVLLERTQDLESNIRLKFLRCCHRVIRHAAQLADDIEAFRYGKAAPMQTPSSSDIEAILRTTDDLAASLYAELEPLKLLYFQKIRPVLVSYWEDESSSDNGYISDTHTIPPSSEDDYDPALSELLERELHPTE